MRTAKRTGWRPIKTAPKDGTEVLLCCVFSDRREVTIARYRNTKRCGPLGCFVWVEFGDNGAIAEGVPTHWMPLPKLPRTKVVEERGT